MAVTYTWSIENLKRNLSDGGITTIHWRCTGSETVGSGDDAVTYTSTNCGKTYHTYDADADNFVAYENVTEEQAIGWVHAALDKSKIETTISNAISAQKTPTTSDGVPW